MHNSNEGKSMKQLLHSMETASLFLFNSLATTPLPPLTSSFFVQLGLTAFKNKE